MEPCLASYSTIVEVVDGVNAGETRVAIDANASSANCGARLAKQSG